ncbi:MAG: hypothetical protein S0880_11550 [Actinomycetota bacterium]|nr:hypothetical protein [Actinomycetota bacterium]
MAAPNGPQEPPQGWPTAPQIPPTPPLAPPAASAPPPAHAAPTTPPPFSRPSAAPGSSQHASGRRGAVVGALAGVGVLVVILVVAATVVVLRSGDDSDAVATADTVDTTSTTAVTEPAPPDDPTGPSEPVDETPVTEPTVPQTTTTTTMTTTTTAPPAVGRTMDDPVLLGDAVHVGDGFFFAVREVDFDATEALQAEDSLVDTPEPGKRSVLVTFDVGYHGLDETVHASSVRLSAVGASGVATDDFSCNFYVDGIGKPMFSGSRQTGRACFSATEADLDTLVISAEGGWGGKRVYFSTHEPSPEPVPFPEALGPVPGSTYTYERNNPVAIGATVEVGDYEMTVSAWRSGIDAEVDAAFPYNDLTPAAGKTWAAATVTVTYVGTETGDAGYDLHFSWLGDDNLGHKEFWLSPQLDTRDVELHPGGTTTFDALFVVPIEEADDVVVYATQFLREDSITFFGGW